MRRVLVIGSGGSGKSTFARRLGEKLGLEVIHLDRFFWHPGWVETPRDEWRLKVERLVGHEAWVMDGNYSGTLELRLAACDTVIFLDLPRALCLWRVLKRVVIYRKSPRPDMAEGCFEKIDLKFLHWVWTYPATRRPRILRLLVNLPADKRVFRLRTPAEVEKFLDGSPGRSRPH